MSAALLCLAAGMVLLVVSIGVLILDLDGWLNRRERDRERRDESGDPWE
jgi:hypothetical protein